MDCLATFPLDYQEINRDIEDLRRLLCQATRQNVIDVMTETISKWQTEVKQLSKEAAERAEKTPTMESNMSVKPVVYHKQIDTYAWDQSDKFMKIYVTIPGVQSISKDKVTCDYKEQSFKLVVSELNNYTYTSQVAKLLHYISVKDSFFKIKSDCVLVMLKKQDEGKTWSHVTQQDKQAKDTKKTPETKPDADPQDSLMGLLKGMYDDGDDDMKKTIKKAFYESRMKKNPGMDDMGMGGLGL